jgi:hypothetical protein
MLPLGATLPVSISIAASSPSPSRGFGTYRPDASKRALERTVTWTRSPAPPGGGAVPSHRLSGKVSDERFNLCPQRDGAPICRGEPTQQSQGRAAKLQQCKRVVRSLSDRRPDCLLARTRGSREPTRPRSRSYAKSRNCGRRTTIGPRLIQEEVAANRSGITPPHRFPGFASPRVAGASPASPQTRANPASALAPRRAIPDRRACPAVLQSRASRSRQSL